MIDQLITVSGALQLCIGMSRMQEHETAEGKSNSLIARQSSLIEQLFVNWNPSWTQTRNLPPNVAMLSTKVPRFCPLFPCC